MLGRTPSIWNRVIGNLRHSPKKKTILFQGGTPKRSTDSKNQQISGLRALNCAKAFTVVTEGLFEALGLKAVLC